MIEKICKELGVTVEDVTIQLLYNSCNKFIENWKELKEWVKYQAENTSQQHNYYGVLEKMERIERGQDTNG